MRSMHDDYLEVVSEHSNELCKRQGIKMYDTVELSLNLCDMVDSKAAYLVGREFR